MSLELLFIGWKVFNLVLLRSIPVRHLLRTPRSTTKFYFAEKTETWIYKIIGSIYKPEISTNLHLLFMGQIKKTHQPTDSSM